MNLEDRVIVISGASGGLGQVVARSMAKSGAKLVLLGRNAANLESLSSDLNISENDRLVVSVDLNEPSGAQTAAAAAIQKFGKIDVLLQLVGGWSGGKSLTEVNPDEVASMLQQHLWTTFYLTQAFVPYLVENEWGRVIVVSSPFAANPRAKGGPYSISKSAQEALMLTLAQELKGSGVTANIITVKTIDVEHAREKDPTPKNATWTFPEEIAEAISYLVSNEASMINGTRLPLYGSQP